jgi:phage recombination protein Bet
VTAGTAGTEIAIVQNQGALALRSDQVDWTPQQRAALAQIGVGEAPAGDQLVFLHVAQRMGLDPFNKEIYMIGRWDSELGRKKWTIQVGIDGFRSKSEEHPQFAGVGDEEYCGPDGQWRDVWVDEEPPIAARFSVYRTDQDKPVRAVAHYREYVQRKKDGNPTLMWATRPAGQLIKCAEALARRRAFPRTLGGVHVHEEMEHLDNPAPAPRIVIESEREQPPAAEPDWDALITEHETARDVGKLWDLRKLAQGMRPNDGALLNRIADAWQRTKATVAVADADTQAPPKGQMNRLFALLGEGGITSDEHRYRLASHHLDRDITSFKDLTASDVSRLITDLEKLKADGRLIKPAPDATPAESPPTATKGDQK